MASKPGVGPRSWRIRFTELANWVGAASIDGASTVPQSRYLEREAGTAALLLPRLPSLLSWLLVDVASARPPAP